MLELSRDLAWEFIRTRKSCEDCMYLPQIMRVKVKSLGDSRVHQMTPTLHR